MKERRKNFILFAVMATSLLLAGGCSKRVVNNYYNYYGVPYGEGSVINMRTGRNSVLTVMNPSALYNVNAVGMESPVVEATVLTIEPIKKIGNTIIAKVGEITLTRDKPYKMEPFSDDEERAVSVVPEITPKTAVPLALILGGMSFIFLARNRRKKAELTELSEDEWRGLKFFWKFLEGSLKKRGKL
jgi:hypothetical protein